MSIRVWGRQPGMRVAVGGLAVAVLTTTWTLVNALQADAIPDAAPTTVASLQGSAGSSAKAGTDISSVVENDLFAADRSAPAAPYRMPGDPDPNDKPAGLPEKPVLLGTGVATDNRNFATVSLRGERPTLVRVGDKIGDWIVRSIERGKIALTTAGGVRIDVTVPKPGT